MSYLGSSNAAHKLAGTVGLACSFAFYFTAKTMSVPMAISIWLIYTILGLLLVNYIQQNSANKERSSIGFILFGLTNVLPSLIFFASRFQ